MEIKLELLHNTFTFSLLYFLARYSPPMADHTAPPTTLVADPASLTEDDLDLIAEVEDTLDLERYSIVHNTSAAAPIPHTLLKSDVRKLLIAITEERRTNGALAHQMEWASRVRDSSRAWPRQCCWWSLNLSRPCTYGKHKRPRVFRNRKQPRHHEYLCTQHLDQERKVFGSGFSVLIKEQLRERELERERARQTR